MSMRCQGDRFAGRTLLRKVEYKRRLVEFLVWMHYQEEYLADEPKFEFSAVVKRFDGL